MPGEKRRHPVAVLDAKERAGRIGEPPARRDVARGGVEHRRAGNVAEIAHIGDHADEGWDLCDTPACQVYRGVGAEHRLTNRAVEETAGLVAVFAGEPIDAMYSSTCGGHTEDAAYLFPDRAQPYLRGVPCLWDRPIELVGSGTDGPWLSTSGMSATLAVELLRLPAAAWCAALLSLATLFAPEIMMAM